MMQALKIELNPRSNARMEFWKFCWDILSAESNNVQQKFWN